MKDQNLRPSRPPLNLEILFLSFFGIGFFPFAPGTAGTLATLPFLYFLGRHEVPVLFLFPFFCILTAGATFITQAVQTKLQDLDPPWIVIDEVLGMFVTWAFFPTANLLYLFLQFAFFRFFDIVKIWPASYFDRDVEHGAGTIADDLVSGVYAGIVFILVQKFILSPFF